MEAIETALIVSGLSMVVLLWAAALGGAAYAIWDTGTSLLDVTKKKTKHQ